MLQRSCVGGLLLFSALTQAAYAEEGKAPESEGPLIEAIKAGKPIIDVRYRYEWKDQAGFTDNAYAHTVRTRLGYETGEFFNFKALVEFENVFSLGDDNFNSTTNGLTGFPVIADPDATEVNRAQLTFTGIDKTPITIGRQRFNLNNHRFVGAVDFRQNQQTFDAVRLSSKVVDNLTFDYLYIDRVHRIFGDDNPGGEFNSDSHVISAAYTAGKLGTVKAYGLLLDLEEAPALSSATWGVRYENNFVVSEDAGVKLGVVAEYARQTDYAANTVDYSEDYIHGEATLKVSAFSLKGGYEQLGGDGTASFKTPLATLHKFQGFADVFLATPAAGIEDIYGTVSWSWKNVPVADSMKLFVTYHDFSSQSGNIDFGHEIDAGLNIKYRKHWSLEFKGAVYEGDGVFADRSIIWTSLRFQL